MGEGANQKRFFTEENENVINEVGKVIILGSLTLVGFDRYGHTDTDTDMVIPIYSIPIPIPILPSKIHQTDTDTDNRYIPILSRYHTYI